MGYCLLSRPPLFRKVPTIGCPPLRALYLAEVLRTAGDTRRNASGFLPDEHKVKVTGAGLCRSGPSLPLLLSHARLVERPRSFLVFLVPPEIFSQFTPAQHRFVGSHSQPCLFPTAQNPSSRP
jgi:hypothetical protein